MHTTGLESGHEEGEKKLLRRLQQSAERVAEIALQFVRLETGADLKQLGITPPASEDGDWEVMYEGSNPGMDPNVIIVLVSDETGVARFFPVL